MTNSTSATNVVGRAVYLELRSPNEKATYQLLLTPPMRVPSNPSQKVMPVMYSRQLSESFPKRTWRNSVAAMSDFDNVGTIPEMLERRLRVVDSRLERLIGADYKVYKEPIVVEVSEDDIKDIMAFRTPYKVLGRVERVRKAKGFSKHPLASKVSL